MEKEGLPFLLKFGIITLMLTLVSVLLTFLIWILFFMTPAA